MAKGLRRHKTDSFDPRIVVLMRKEKEAAVILRRMMLLLAGVMLALWWAGLAARSGEQRAPAPPAAPVLPLPGSVLALDSGGVAIVESVDVHGLNLIEADAATGTLRRRSVSVPAPACRPTCSSPRPAPGPAPRPGWQCSSQSCWCRLPCR